jgi:hypothetical protein
MPEQRFFNTRMRSRGSGHSGLTFDCLNLGNPYIDAISGHTLTLHEPKIHNKYK